MCFALVCIAIAGACSTQSKNEGDGGSALVAATTECANAGLACIECCQAAHGDLALSAFVEGLKWCACTPFDAGCIANCSPVCDSGAIQGECTVCVHEGDLSPCIDDNCTGPSCRKFLGCVKGCG